MARIFRRLSQFSKKEIDRAFADARCVAKQQELTILASPRQGEFARILPIIPRKVGTAPVRNKLRRRLKAIFYESQLYERDHDLLVLTRKGAGELTFEQLQEILARAAKRAASGAGDARHGGRASRADSRG